MKPPAARAGDRAGSALAVLVFLVVAFWCWVLAIAACTVLVKIAYDTVVWTWGLW